MALRSLRYLRTLLLAALLVTALTAGPRTAVAAVPRTAESAGWVDRLSTALGRTVQTARLWVAPALATAPRPVLTPVVCSAAPALALDLAQLPLPPPAR